MDWFISIFLSRWIPWRITDLLLRIFYPEGFLGTSSCHNRYTLCSQIDCRKIIIPFEWITLSLQFPFGYWPVDLDWKCLLLDSLLRIRRVGCSRSRQKPLYIELISFKIYDCWGFLISLRRGNLDWLIVIINLLLI